MKVSAPDRSEEGEMLQNTWNDIMKGRTRPPGHFYFKSGCYPEPVPRRHANGEFEDRRA